MATITLYTTDSSLLEAASVVTEVTEVTPSLWCVAAAATPFYPGGGGQAGDIGTIVGANGSFYVKSTRRRLDGVVDHLGTIEGHLVIGEPCVLTVNAPSRMLNTRLHSGGELVCMAIEEIRPGTPVTKANHRQGQSSITLGVEIAPTDRDRFLRDVEATARRLILAALPVSILTVDDADAAAAICGFKPSINNGPIRIVQISNFARPCAGTHVQCTTKVGGIRIRSFAVRGGETKIGYDLDGTSAEVGA